MNLTIDIIIPTFSRPQFIGPLARSLEKFLKDGDTIFVVWQGAHKPEIQSTARLRFIHSAPPNLPKARNKGIAEGTGAIALFLDDDIEAFDENLLEIHRKIHEDACIGAVAGFIDDPLFTRQGESCSRYDETTGEIIQNFSLLESRDTISVMGAHMSFKRAALASIGGFDENFKKNALWEEIDCAFRMRKSGWRIRYCPEAKVRHLRAQSGGCRSKSAIGYMYHQFANTAYFAARHAPRVYYRSWFRFWKYRLEFLSRRRVLWLRHDPRLVGAGILGAIRGIVRYLTRNKIGIKP